MLDEYEFQEIENYGGEDAEEFHKDADNSKKKSNSSLFLLFQTVVCVLLLLTVVAVKMKDGKTFEKIKVWYHTEINKEIVLPSTVKESESKASGNQLVLNINEDELRNI